MARKGENKSSMEIEEAMLMLTPCTAAKSEKDAVAGVELECPSTKRKSVGGSSYKAGDEPPEGWIDVYKLADPPSSDPFGLKSREEAIDKILADAVLGKQGPAAAAEAAAAPPKPKRRLTKDEIMSILAVKPRPFPTADFAEFESPETVAEMKRQFEEEEAFFRASDEKCEAFRQQVIRGLEKDGYYEVDEDYIARREKSKKRAMQQASPFAFLDPEDLRRRVATPEQMEQWLREGSTRRYVPSEEDARLISYGDPDTSDEEEDA